jgi:DNA replication protein DnaC
MGSCLKCNPPDPRFDECPADPLKGRIYEPWCPNCRTKYASEYDPIYRAWFNQNASAVLGRMGVPSRFRSCSMEGFQAKEPDQRRIFLAAQLWLDGDEPPGLFLCGPCGTGKTHLAVGVLLELKRLRFSGQFASAQELIMECRDSFRGQSDDLSSILDKYTDADALLLDDLGTEKTTEFVRETIFVLIDRFYRNEKLLIVTSNFNLGDLAERLGERTADRLVEMCQAVMFTGSSFRHQIAAKRITTKSLPAGQVVQ